MKLYDRGAGLLIVDPVFAHLSAGLDSHRDHSIRRALAPLKRLAEEVGLAALGIAHLNKAPSSDIFQRVGGSIGLSAAARSILLLTADPEAEEGPYARVLSHAKTNLGEYAPALRCRTASRDVDVGQNRTSPVPVLEIGTEAPGLRVFDVLASAPTEEERTAIHDAIDFLHDMLDDGPRPARDVTNASRKLGITAITLRRARQRVGVVAQPVRSADGRRVSEWVLYISSRGSPATEPLGDHEGMNPLKTASPPTELDEESGLGGHSRERDHLDLENDEYDRLEREAIQAERRTRSSGSADAARRLSRFRCGGLRRHSTEEEGMITYGQWEDLTEDLLADLRINEPVEES